MKTLSEKLQRLRTLENSIRSNFEKFVETGVALKEIRDDELYRGDGFATWDAYLKQRVGEEFGIERRQAYNLINAAIIRPKLPEPKLVHKSAHDEKPVWKPSVVQEFARLAPEDTTKPGHPRDLASLRKSHVQQVAKAAIEIAKERGKALTAEIVREAVDANLGIAKKKRAPKPEPAGIDLPDYLRQKIGQLNGIIENLATVPGDGWTRLEKNHPGLALELADVCDSLAELLRS